MVQESIKPNQQIAPHFVAAIISFLRISFGEKEYNDLRIGDPTKKIGADYGSVQFSSLSPNKEITSLWNFLQENDAGLEVKNITSGGSDEKVTAIKILLDLSKEFLLKYGNDQVKQFCEDLDFEDEQSQNHSNDTPGQGGVNPVDSQPSSGGEDEGIIKTAKELIEAVADVGDPRAKSRMVSRFFKWYLEQNGITEYEVRPRTAYKYKGKEPEFVVKISVSDQVSVAFDVMQSQECDVDIVGADKDTVRVKNLSVDPGASNTNEPKGNQQQPSGTKKSATSAGKKKATKKKVAKKVTKKPVPKVEKRKSDAKPKTGSKKKIKLHVSKPSSNPKKGIQSKSVTEIVQEFLQKTSPTENDIAGFRKIIALKKEELRLLFDRQSEILTDVEMSLINLVGVRKRISEVC